jgi:decaprenylphospho-beta-D-ribofuranose 2-oxidase
MEPSVVRPLSGWGRFPVETCRIYRPEKRASLAAILASGAEPSYIARGLGRSYGDAALNRNAGVISFERLNRLIAFDAATGVLECETGVTFAEILDCFLSRGYFLPVTPGTKFVTLGGAIAHDVHGKNHHRVGTISSFVLDLLLRTPEGDLVTCSPQQNADVFWATIGGAGLTGLILSARIRLQRVETAYVLVDFLKVHHFEEAIAAMEESDHLYEFSVAWIDCLAGGKALGRSVLMRANPAMPGDLPSGSGNPLSPRRRSERPLPFDFPPGLLNPFTVGAFNSLFYGLHRTARGRLADIDSFFYPLDSIRDWNRMYGRRGFVQYQLVFPLETSRAGLTEVLERVSASGRGSFLGVLKRFGDANAGLLSFPLPGYTLALDLPVSDGLVPFLRGLDALVLRHGGRLYMAKDAVMAPESFAAMYPRLEEFRSIKARLDPKNRLSSSLARRVGIDPS